jgi:hypothetical protein
VIAVSGGRNIALASIMEFGDEFVTLDTGVWTVVKGSTQTVGVSAGILGIYTQYVADNYASIFSSRTFGTGTALRCRMKSAHWGTAGYHEYFGYAPNGAGARITGRLSGDATSGQKMQNYDGATTTWQAFSGWTADTWGIAELRRTASQSSIVAGSGSEATNTSNYPTGAIGLVFSTATVGALMYLDWIAVRKYVADEPLAGTVRPSATNRALCRPLSASEATRCCCTGA